MQVQNRRFDFVVKAVLAMLSAVCVLPLLLLLVTSVTSEKALLLDGYSFFPREFGLDAYRYLWHSKGQFLRAYQMTIMVTLSGTVLSLILTSMLSYPLSRKTLPGRNCFMFFVFFTMLFNGGLIPSYLMWTQLFHVKDTIWALIIPNLLMNGFSVIVMRTYFATNIPEEILEAAVIDGAGEMRILVRIVLPLSSPIIATMALLTGLVYWNDWQNGLYFIMKRTDYYTVQNLLNRLLTSMDFISNNAANSSIAAGISVPSVGVRMAIAIVALIPVLIIYPFLQKGFVRGIVIGGVKG